MPRFARLAIPLGLIVVVVAALLLWRALAPLPASDGGTRRPAAPTLVPLTALEAASGWINGGPLTADSLRGRPAVVLLWSDTEPLSLDALPEADAWQRAYGRFGLRVVAVHQPEYSFAADSSVAARIVRRLGLAITVALDAGTRIAPRLGAGDELPAWVVVDSDGFRAFAGAGDRSEEAHRALRDLLRREHPNEGLPDESGAPVAAAVSVRRIPCGTSRVTAGPLARSVPGRTETFTAQFRYQEEGELYTPYLVGRWTPAAEGVTSARGGAADFLALRYEGGRVDGVMGAAGEPVRVWVLRDEGWLPPDDRGDDVRADARGATFVDVDEPRLYSIARGPGAHVLKLSPAGPDATIYEFAIRPE